MTSLTLRKGESQLSVGFMPHDMSVSVEFDGRTYRPEWRLPGELQTCTDRTGPPEFWAADGRHIFFDKPAGADYPVCITP